MEVKIYCIEDCNGLKYVGSTKQKLNIRLSNHRCRDDCMSRELNLDNCKIYTLEVTDENHRKIREQYWIDNTECVNYQNTIFDKKGRTRYLKQYRENNLDKLKQYKKEYDKQHGKQIYQKYKDKRKKYGRDRYHLLNSWGGDPRSNNNLLKIDLDIFI